MSEVEAVSGLGDKFRGALLGTAVGDALGAPFEGWTHVSHDPLETVGRADEPLRWTDDTHMTIATAESLIAADGFDGADMAARFAAAHEQEPWRGYGAGPPQVFAAIRAGAAWDEPARQLFGGTGSFGNGAAMRAAPAGLLRHRDFRGAAHLARQCAAITHTHELGLQGAALQAAAVAWLVGARPGPVWNGQDALLDDLRAVVPAAEFQRQLAGVAALAAAAPEHAGAHLGNGIAAIQAVPAALWAFLAHPGSFADTVRAAILMGGDTDTIAAMAGALSGAFLGASAIPGQWRARVEASDHITALADRLHTAAATPLSAIAPD